MSTTVYWLRLLASIPVYGLSILVWVQTPRSILDAIRLWRRGYLSSYEIGLTIGYVAGSLLTAVVAYGIWRLARYLRTAYFRKQPKPAPTPWP
ncbi:hypothetical protein [Pseudomonas sp. AF03-9]|jgi:hypothetical protein|uniref:hypothetical protein n=1 Tax=Pseudomonas sp. AF03-9 TaxID=2849867 RepID=UPI001CF941B5|nr:hypothetical protein [Pseudomonas sp. AF03-9]